MVERKLLKCYTLKIEQLFYFFDTKGIFMNKERILYIKTSNVYLIKKGDNLIHNSNNKEDNSNGKHLQKK